MYQVRIADLTASSLINNSITSNRDEYTRKMQQVSTGEKYISRSDDPAATEQIATMQQKQSKNSQWLENLKTAENWEDATGSAVDTIIDTMQSINELLVEANSGINDTSSRESLAQELETLIETLVQEGNSTYLDSYLFAGTASTDKPFTVTYDTDGKILDVAYLGVSDPAVDADTEQRKVSVSSSSQISYGLIGESSDSSLFKYSYTDGSGTTSTVRLFDELISFREQILSGESLDEETISKIQAGLDNVISQSVQNSSSQSRIESLQTTINAVDDQLTTSISDMASIDEASAITELYSVQAALQASLQMVNKINSMSIINYIN